MAYAAELELDGSGRLRGGEDHNWHRIGQEALEADGVEDYDVEETDGTKVLSARAPVVSSTGGNNVANNDNIEAGDNNVWMFPVQQLRSKHAQRGPGLPSDGTGVAGVVSRHLELRKRDGEEGYVEDVSLETRQTGGSRTIYISANTCLQPYYVGSGVQSAAPPQLTLYVSSDSSNQSPGPNSAGRQREIGFVDGFANASISASGDWYISVHAPSLPNSFKGVWNYELAVSIDDYFHVVVTNTSNLFPLDTDSNAALLVTDNLTQGNDTTQSYKQWMRLTAPYVVFASNVNDTRTMGLSQSFCGLNNNAQIAGKQAQADGNGTGVQMQMTTRGLGNLPKEQFYINTLNRSSTYVAHLAQVGNSTNSGNGVVGGGGIVWKTTNFTTKSDGNCALLFNLDFCSEVAYAVPSSPGAIANYSNFQALYDNSTLKAYQNFNYSLQQIPCTTNPDSQYSLARNCGDCARAYKDWLCAVSMPRCADFSNPAPYLQKRNMGQPFINGSSLAASLLQSSYIPMSSAPTLEGTVAYDQTYLSSMATNSSRNPLIDTDIKPGPYKEVLPCADLCYGLVQSCPAALGFGCPYPGLGLEVSYGNRDHNGGDTLSCSYLGAFVYSGGAGRVGVDVWKGMAVSMAVGLVFLFV